MNLRVLPSSDCTHTCATCRRATAPHKRDCDSHMACRGYGSSANCPPLIVLAVHECLNAALEIAQPALTPLRTAHA